MVGGMERMACVTEIVSEVEWTCINADLCVPMELLAVLRVRGAAVQVGGILAAAGAAMRRRCRDAAVECV